MNNRALTRGNLAKRRKLEDDTCLFFSEKETIHHVFFDCVVARQCWKVVSDSLGVEIGVDLTNIETYWLSNKKHCLSNIVSSTVIWAMWKLRNDLCF